MELLPLFLVCFWLGGLVLSVAIDNLRYRRKAAPQPVSVLIPCHNAEASIEAAVESVFNSWPRGLLDVQVINDASTDGSAEVLEALSARFPLRVIHQRRNLGKSRSLNQAVHACQNDLVLFLDADTQVNAAALEELITRMGHSQRVAAVSSPCTPSNSGWLPMMQALEYNMHRLFMGANNLVSVHALWGGCLMTRKAVFLAHGGFGASAVAEDTDYAFRLNRSGLRVEQGSRHVKTVVPEHLRHWVHQKIRWTSGAFQCGFRYPGVLLRNPILLFGAAVNLILVSNAFLGWSDGFSGGDLYRFFTEAHARNLSIIETLHALTAYQDAVGFLLDVVTGLSIFLFSFLYVLPLVNQFRDSLKLALVIPYTLGYLPMFTVVTAVGFLFWAAKLRKLNVHQRAW